MTELREMIKAVNHGGIDADGSTDTDRLEALFKVLIDKREVDITKVDRFEVIDETGRAYVKGSIYGSPVKIELSYQDDGRTLKVFVSDKHSSKEDV